MVLSQRAVLSPQKRFQASYYNMSSQPLEQRRHLLVQQPVGAEQDGAAALSAGQLLWELLIDRIMLALIEKMHVWLEKESFYALCRITNLKCWICRFSEHFRTVFKWVMDPSCCSVVGFEILVLINRSLCLLKQETLLCGVNFVLMNNVWTHWGCWEPTAAPCSPFEPV